MENYIILRPKQTGAFSDRIEELFTQVTDYLSREVQAGRTLQLAKVFLSDAQNQYQQFVESELYQNVLSKVASSIIEQTPLDGSKVSVLLVTSDSAAEYIYNSLRLCAEETKGSNSYLQTVLLFEKYIKSIETQGLDIATHLVRTWIYVADIDVNYEGVVKARNDIFKRYGLTADTHFIASTGIGGNSEIRTACVAIDFLTYPGICEENKTYLKALDHLNPTHEYGVAFERGTMLETDHERKYFISGTASIDRHGHVIYLGNVIRQTERLLENIDALLRNAGATLCDVNYFIIYLRDLSDYQAVDRYMEQHYPDKPRILVQAKVCRPEWLVEMECTAGGTL